MGFDMHMRETPPAAEVKKAGLDAADPGYFRYNVSAMPIMVTTMMWAGVVADDEAEPTFPSIPDSVTDARRDAMTKAIWEPSLDAKLPAADRAIVVRYRAVLQGHSKHAGKVPSYKFQTNDGFLVAPDECTAIVTALKSYKPDPAKLAKLKQLWHDTRVKLEAQIGKGAKMVGGGDELELTLEDWRQWIAEWAAYNAVAARHGGYTID